METERRYRMYGLVPYQLTGIQQAIQFGHAVVEYGLLYFTNPDYQRWAKHDKTFIILNGGTTNIEKPGTLNVHEYQIEEKGIRHANFFEEDLGDQLTACVFLVDDRVWDKETWPDYQMTYEEQETFKQLKRKSKPEDIPGILESFESYRIWFNKFGHNYNEVERIVWLRDYLSPRNLKLA